MSENKEVREDGTTRVDGYMNMLNKYGTYQDNSTAYYYNRDWIANDQEITAMYESNGLFVKIIDRPAEEAIKHGYDFDAYGDYAEIFQNKLETLDWESKAAQALKWMRLYGGAIAVMLVDDGSQDLLQPLNWRKVRSIEDIRVFDRTLISPSPLDVDSATEYTTTPFGEPDYYYVASIYGSFYVHRSRCLVFRNGILPEHTTNQQYRDWGVPEFVRIKDALRECVTTHSNGVKLLERSVQAIYKMKNLANLLATDKGEDKTIARLQVIDMARGILNSIAIDSEGEDYNFINAQMTGVQEIIDATCNMLSAVTDIPQTILFGRSPAGMNATGQADFENYYNMVERVQKMNLLKNSRVLFDLIAIELKKQGKIDRSMKDFPVEFNPLWSLSEQEQTALDLQKAQIEQTKAATAQVYVGMQALDPSEVRKALTKNDDYEIQDILDEGDEEWPEDAFNPIQSQQEQDPMAAMMGGMAPEDEQPMGGDPGQAMGDPTEQEEEKKNPLEGLM